MSYLKHSLLAICFLLGTISVFSQVNITADKTSGCDSLTAIFTLDPMSDTIVSIVWDYGDGIVVSGDSVSSHHFPTPGKYSISALINGNSTVNFSSPIFVYSLPNASFSYSDSIELGPYSFSFLNLPQEVDTFTYTYEWIFPDGILASTKSSVFTFLKAGVYEVELVVSNEFGCSDTVARNIVAADILAAPNVFTPNLDGFNDYFEVKTNGVNLFEFSVFARSGMLVYRSKTTVIQWDGRSSSGDLLKPGVYYYVIRQLDGDALMDKIGFVHILL